MSGVKFDLEKDLAIDRVEQFRQAADPVVSSEELTQKLLADGIITNAN